MKMDAKFWRKYESIANSQKVALKTRKWYLRWAMAFEKALPITGSEVKSSEVHFVNRRS